MLKEHISMKTKKLLYAAIPALTISLLVGCNKPKEVIPDSREREPATEIGDIINAWTDKLDSKELPLGLSSAYSQGQIIEGFGNEDNQSLYFEVQHLAKKNYLGSDLVSNIYFKDDDAGNGDIVSLCVYVPSDANIASLQLEVFTSGMSTSFKSDVLNIDESNSDQWNRLVVTFDTLETLGAIRLNYKLVDEAYLASFYVDDIETILGEETVKTDYVSNDESLYQAYEQFFKVGTCMPSRLFNNSMIRKIIKENFNSVTAENEAKPERVLVQESSQRLEKDEELNEITDCSITIKPFEKVYDWCEAHHIGVRHHTFVWFDQTPAWFFKKGYKDNADYVSKEVMIKRMENFIRKSLEVVNARWPGLVYAIDVSNEAIQNGNIRTKDNNNQNPNNWYQTIGKDFVYYAFKFARQYADEGQKLYYNDYSYDYDTNNCKYAVNTLLKQAIAEQLIDGVGIQGHTDSDQNMDAFITNAKMIKQKGLECQITELDITINGTSTSEYNKQKRAYSNLLTKVLKNNISGATNITAVVVWGVVDDASWKSSQNPLLFTKNYGKKPAYYGFLEAVQPYLVQDEAVE